MTLSADLLLFVCLAYVATLFGIAFLVDRAAGRQRFAWLRSPVVYTLSISVYCTSWTFYGAVGSAARNGLEFITIYLGPTLVFVGWFWVLRKLVRIGREQRITSIADLISSRYGKSSSLAVLVTLIALVATTPYIALQLQSLTRSYETVAGDGDAVATAFWIAAGLALFTILFGTRNLDANERHHGVVAAIAVEAVVKLVALIAVGLFVVFGAGGLGEIFSDVPAEVVYGGGDAIFGPRWAVLTFLSATAIICLPRQFQVTVVENVDERHLATASWLFPLYLFGMCLFIMPIAIAGLKTMPAGSNPDLYVLSLPLSQGRNDLALLAFLGGFSSATSMVIVASIAVSTMVSNHIVMPIAMRVMAGSHARSGDVRNLLLATRRISIGVVLGLGYLYFWFSGGSDALAAIGLIAFVGVAQFLPSILGGIFWRGATRMGALAGLLCGAALWVYTLFLPSFGGAFVMSTEMLANGPWGLLALRPQALFGLDGLDPLVHAVIWSLGVNTLVFMVVSVLSSQNALERLQGAQFVDVFRSAGSHPTFVAGSANAEDMFALAQRILGTLPAQRLFDDLAREQGLAKGLPRPTDRMIARLERELAGSVGAASAHAMVGSIAGQAPISVTELFDIADETHRLIETTRQLSDKSRELERAAAQLREANDRLREMDQRKDDFLSQVSHELRTPMTSISSFAEILRTEPELTEAERARFATIMHEESIRLTGLLDEILDLSRLEAGGADMPVAPLDLGGVAAAAVDTVSVLARNRDVRIENLVSQTDLNVSANGDRLRQVLINLLSNAIKYNTAERPEVRLSASTADGMILIDVIDNGGGVSRTEAQYIFEKFARGTGASAVQGAGLGLPISRAIMQAMGGDLTIVFSEDGTSFFRVHLRRT